MGPWGWSRTLFNDVWHEHGRGKVSLQVSEVLSKKVALEPSVEMVMVAMLLGQRVHVHFRVRGHRCYASHLEQRVLLGLLMPARPLLLLVFTPGHSVLYLTSRWYDRVVL